MGVTSLVLGIVALVCCFIPGAGIVGIILGILGIILGALGKKNPEKKGIATGGLVCSIIATAICGITYIACAACVGAIGSVL